MISRFYFAFACVMLLSNVDLGIGKIRPKTTTIGDRTFHFYNTPVTFDVANQRCVENGGKLAVVRNRTVAAKLRHLVRLKFTGKSDMILRDPTF